MNNKSIKGLHNIDKLHIEYTFKQVILHAYRRVSEMHSEILHVDYSL